VTTGADGRFSIPGVLVPYNIALLPPGEHTAVVYAGLTRADPSLLYVAFQGVSKSAWISGTVPPTSGTSTSTVVVFTSGRYVIAGSAADATTGDYSFNVQWRGAADTQLGRLYLLRWTADAISGLPLSYDGYASKALVITAGSAYNGNDFAAAELIDPPEQTISGTVAIPPGYNQTFRRLFLYLDAVPVYWDEVTSVGTFSFTVPAVSGVTFGVGVGAQDLASRSSWVIKTGISGNSTDVDLLLLPAAQLTLPANGAPDVDASTSLSWTEGGGAGVNFVYLIPDGSTSANPAFVLATTAAHTKIPDLAAEGLGLPATTVYHWAVDRVFPVASVDDAADDRYLDLIGWKPSAGGETLSEIFTFTTKAATATAVRASAVGPPTTALQAMRQRAVMGGAGAPGIPMNHR